MISNDFNDFGKSYVKIATEKPEKTFRHVSNVKNFKSKKKN